MPLAYVASPGAHTKSSFVDEHAQWIDRKINTNCSEAANRNAVFSDSKTESSAAQSCTYLDLNESENSISKLEGTLPILGVFVIQAWRVGPSRFRDVRHNFLVWLVLMMCGEWFSKRYNTLPAFHCSKLPVVKECGRRSLSNKYDDIYASLCVVTPQS